MHATYLAPIHVHKADGLLHHRHGRRLVDECHLVTVRVSEQAGEGAITHKSESEAHVWGATRQVREELIV